MNVHIVSTGQGRRWRWGDVYWWDLLHCLGVRASTHGWMGHGHRPAHHVPHGLQQHQGMTHHDTFSVELLQPVNKSVKDDSVDGLKLKLGLIWIDVLSFRRCFSSLLWNLKIIKQLHLQRAHQCNSEENTPEDFLIQPERSNLLSLVRVIAWIFKTYALFIMEGRISAVLLTYGSQFHGV